MWRHDVIIDVIVLSGCGSLRWRESVCAGRRCKISCSFYSARNGNMNKICRPPFKNKNTTKKNRKKEKWQDLSVRHLALVSRRPQSELGVIYNICWSHKCSQMFCLRWCIQPRPVILILLLYYYFITTSLLRQSEACTETSWSWALNILLKYQQSRPASFVLSVAVRKQLSEF